MTIRPNEGGSVRKPLQRAYLPDEFRPETRCGARVPGVNASANRCCCFSGLVSVCIGYSIVPSNSTLKSSRRSCTYGPCMRRLSTRSYCGRDSTLSGTIWKCRNTHDNCTRWRSVGRMYLLPSGVSRHRSPSRNLLISIHLRAISEPLLSRHAI